MLNKVHDQATVGAIVVMVGGAPIVVASCNEQGAAKRRTVSSRATCFAGHNCLFAAAGCPNL